MIVVDGQTLTLEDLEDVARNGTAVGLDPAARERVARARSAVKKLVREGAPVYGVTTGFGRMAEVPISSDGRRQLQINLLRSHAAGIGAPLAEAEVRTLLLLRANALAAGHSGCRPVVVERLLDHLNRGIHPVVPETGSVGASGDLAPLAHLALPLIGEGWILDAGGGPRHRPAMEVLAEVALEPLELEAKEGLALINGTQVTTGLGVLALLRAERALDQLEVAGAMTLEALRGTPDAFHASVHALRPHPGQLRSADILWSLLSGSEIRESHRHGDPRVQDAYSLRCMPQIHGAARNALAYTRTILETEVNAVTDNPLVFPEEGAVISAGNFHAQIVSQALDLLCLAVTDLVSVSERRIERLLNPDLSNLPAFLAPEPGLNSGYMILQVTVADLLSEVRGLATPASVDSVPTSAGQEDHVSMGLWSARKARRSVAILEVAVAGELLAAAQALEYRRPLRPSPPLARARDLIREKVPALGDDRPVAPDLEAIRSLVASGAFVPARLFG